MGIIGATGSGKSTIINLLMRPMPRQNPLSGKKVNRIRNWRAAHIHSFIMQLPEGYQTVVKEDGTNISNGQKQLLTIARAMLLDSHMVILDEATSNVDTRTEIRIQEAMRRLMRDKTCFVIAHRLSTIRDADRILVVRDGEAVEQGNHESLMARQGAYYQMYQAQFE